MKILDKLRSKLRYVHLTPLKYTDEVRMAYFGGSVTGGNLRNKTVIITGGNGGIGKALCLRFAKEGCKVIFTARSEDKINKMKAYFTTILPDADVEGMLLDITDLGSIKKFVEMVRVFNIDILINNAGVFTDIDRKHLFRSVSVYDFNNTWECNFVGMKVLTEEIATLMDNTNGEGSIINISSICALFNSFRYSPYGISKSAVNYFTHETRKKFPKLNVHAIAPGSVATGMGHLKNGDDISSNCNYLKHIALPEEIASLAAFLASDSGRLITNIPVVASAGENL